MASGGMSAAKGMTALFRRGNNLASSAIRLRAGAGLPVGSMEIPSSTLPESAELTWDDGSAFPEPCLDNVAPMVGKYEALAWTSGGLGLFAAIAGLAAWNDKASRIPFAPRDYPYDNLRVELVSKLKEIPDQFWTDLETNLLWMSIELGYARTSGSVVFYIGSNPLAILFHVQADCNKVTMGRGSCFLVIGVNLASWESPKGNILS